MEDPGFQEQLAAVQKKKLLSDKEADFRQYLVRSGGAEELVKLLVGLQEAGSAPADPVAFIQHFFSTQELALVKGRPIDNIMALQEEGAAGGEGDEGGGGAHPGRPGLPEPKNQTPRREDGRDERGR